MWCPCYVLVGYAWTKVTKARKSSSRAASHCNKVKQLAKPSLNEEIKGMFNSELDVPWPTMPNDTKDCVDAMFNSKHLEVDVKDPVKVGDIDVKEIVAKFDTAQISFVKAHDHPLDICKRDDDLAAYLKNHCGYDGEVKTSMKYSFMRLQSVMDLKEKFVDVSQDLVHRFAVAYLGFNEHAISLKDMKR